MPLHEHPFFPLGHTVSKMILNSKLATMGPAAAACCGVLELVSRSRMRVGTNMYTCAQICKVSFHRKAMNFV